MQSINKKCDCVLLYVCCRVYIHPYFSVPIQAPLGDATAQGGLQVEPPPQCCACGEARYKMHFQGLWSRQTHPKGFPIEDGMFQLLSPGRPNPRETVLLTIQVSISQSQQTHPKDTPLMIAGISFLGRLTTGVSYKYGSLFIGAVNRECCFI